MTDAMHSAQPEAPIDAEPVLSVRGATKTFGAVVALDGVDLEVRSGEVLALLGDNGAGKSTLIKCISGVHKLDRGEIRIDGALVQISSAADARSNGIETVYQDLALFDNLNPTANFFAGREVAAPFLASSGAAVDEEEGDVHPHQGAPRPAADPPSPTSTRTSR